VPRCHSLLEGYLVHGHAWRVNVVGETRPAGLHDRGQEALLHHDVATLLTDVLLGEGPDGLPWYGVPCRPFLPWWEEAAIGMPWDCCWLVGP